VNAVVKIVLFFLAVVVLGAVLAPMLYWAVHALEPWALANGLLRWEPVGNQVEARGPFTFLEADFQKFFNRAMLLSALLLLWPALRWMGIRRGDLRLQQDARWRSHLLVGLAVGGGVVALMAAGYVFLGYYHLKGSPPWGALPRIALSAVVVAMLEEWLFRGMIFGLFAKAMKPVRALFWTTLVFATLHFLKPDEDVHIAQVDWSSGFALLPYVFHQFTEPAMLLAGLTTLFTLGWLLGYARLRTGSLWMGIGIHAGVVFVKMGFSKITKRDGELLPWIGPELQIGLVPVALLLIALFLVWRRAEYEELLPNVTRKG
jgi:membrane protease YdiL (CAAX protease family)